MEKADSSREVLTWGTLDRDILAIIFNKLNILELTIGASRVCIHWFLVSHKKTLWNTIDLTKFQYNGKRVIYKHRVDNEALSLSNILIKTRKYFNFCGVQGIKLSLTQKKKQSIKLKKLVIEMTKLSRAATQNLLLNFHSRIQPKDLTFVAERMPNIEKLVLTVSWYLDREKIFRFAFSQWKNLKTLILPCSHYHSLLWFEFKIVGDNCSNLTNLKLWCYLSSYDVGEIVSYLQSLKRLSLQYSTVSTAEVLALIRGLRNLTILNLTHCNDLLSSNDENYIGVQAEAATHQKLEKVIICSKYDCKVCKDGPAMYGNLDLYEKNWRNDEIKELEF